jgi:hypothetical protein
MEEQAASVVSTGPKPKPLQKIYQFLKQKNKVKASTYEEFEAKMQANPEKLKGVYYYVTQSGGKIKASSYEEFEANMGVKKKVVESLDKANRLKNLFFLVVSKIKALLGSNQFKGSFLSHPINHSTSNLIENKL